MRFLPFLIPALLLAGVAAYGSPEESALDTSPTVHVHLASLGAPAHLTVSGEGLRVRDGEGSAVVVDGPVAISAAGGQVRIGERSAESFRLKGEALRVQSSRVPREYPGALVVTAARGGLVVTNECSLERYTEGVLVGECPALFHPQAIRAMAIAARSYCFRKAFMSRAELCDTVHCQVYRGVAGVKESIRDAVRDTCGQCALYDGEVIDAVYCSDCGGFTEANENAWKGTRPVPYLRSVEDAPEPQGEPYCAVNRSHRWTLALTRQRLLSLLGKHASEVSLQVVDTTESGRVRRLRLAPGKGENEDAAETASGSGRTFCGEEWRRLLGLSAVKSLKFEIKAAGSGIELEGSGFGHGVGLCQFGANGMARQGAGAAEILKHYYTGITVGPLPSVEEARSWLWRHKLAGLHAARKTRSVDPDGVPSPTPSIP
jgi:stage II sporulation protein D